MEKNIDFGFVADLYDIYVNTKMDIPFYLDLCSQYSGDILELMCGTGRVSLPLLQAGYHLTCVDYSQPMLDVLAKKAAGLPVRILCQDVTQLDLDSRYNLILLPFNSLTEIVDPDLRRQAFQRIFQHLLPGGDFYCTFYNPAYRRKAADGSLKILGKFDLPTNRTLVVTFQNQPEADTGNIIGVQFYEIYDRKNILVEKRYLDIHFALPDREEIQSMAADSGFEVKAIHGDYQSGEYFTGSMFMNFLLHRPD
jgi:SAM-dependent methyltransferase